jgi:hypothetical protein
MEPRRYVGNITISNSTKNEHRPKLQTSTIKAKRVFNREEQGSSQRSKKVMQSLVYQRGSIYYLVGQCGIGEEI